MVDRKNTLGIASYMDTFLPNQFDIELLTEQEINELSNKELKSHYHLLEQYCIIKNKTKQWSKKNFSTFHIKSQEEKNKLTLAELKEECLKMQKYYILTKDITDVKRLSNKKQDKLSKTDYLLYLKNLRIYDDASKLNNMTLKRRKQIYPILRGIMKASIFVSRIKVRILNNNLPKGINDRPIIFVVTHVGKDDIAIFSKAIKEHCIILSGDYESLHNNIEGFITMLNGVEFFDMRSKNERHSINDRIDKDLSNGCNILCSMEAAWNLSPNKVVQELFPGMIYSAINQNAVIVPIGIERFNSKLFGLNVSENIFDPEIYFKNKKVDKETINEAKKEIRQMLAESKLKLYTDEKIRKQITTTRKSIGNYEEYNKKYKQDILKGWTFTEEAIQKKAFRSFDDPKYAFEYLITEYSTLLDMQELIKDNNCSREERLCIESKFNQKYAKMMRDINSNVYPNVIHNQLESIFYQLMDNNRENKNVKIKK